MRKLYGIGFLIVMVMLLTVGLYALKRNSNNNLENEMKFEYRISEDTDFLLKDKEGYVTVYMTDGSLYDYTSIKTSDLPGDLQKEINSGIRIKNVEDLYGFLENYSS